MSCISFGELCKSRDIVIQNGDLKGRNHVDLAVTNDFETVQIHTTTQPRAQPQLSDSLHIENFSIITSYFAFKVFGSDFPSTISVFTQQAKLP